MIETPLPEIQSPLLEEALRCQQNRRRLSKKIHKKTKLLTEVCKNQKIISAVKPLNLTSILKKCHLPEQLSDWLLTKRMAGINSVNGLLALAGKAMSQKQIPLTQATNYTSRQENITQELVNNSSTKAPQKREQKVSRNKTKVQKASDTNIEEGVARNYLNDLNHLNDQDNILQIPFILSCDQLQESDFLKMF